MEITQNVSEINFIGIWFTFQTGDIYTLSYKTISGKYSQSVGGHIHPHGSGIEIYQTNFKSPGNNHPISHEYNRPSLE